MQDERVKTAPAPRRRSRDRGRSGGARGAGLEQRAVAFVVAAGLPLVLALNDGGYDLVTRQEAGLGIWWALALALAFGLLPRARPTRVRAPLAAMVLLVAWTALSLAWTESDERTFEEVARVLTFAGVLVLGLYGTGPRTWTAAAAGISTTALLVPAMAVLGRLVPELRLPGEGALNIELDRLIYPLGYWNAVACWCAMAIAIGLAWSAHLRLGGTRALCLAAVPVAGFASYLTYSRTGVLAVVVAASAAVLLSRNRRTAAVHALAAAVATAPVILVARGQEEIAKGTGGRGAALVALALVAACAACALVAEATGRRKIEKAATPGWLRLAAASVGIAAVVIAVALGPRLASTAVEELASDSYPAASDDPASRLVDLGSSRPEVWSEALDAFASDPVKGIGPGTFEFWWTREGGEEYLLDAHSLYLETVAELGLPGLILVVALLGGLLAAVLRGRRAADRSMAVAATTGLGAAFCVYVFFAAVDWMWESTAVTVLALGAAAVAAAAASEPRGHRRRLSRGRLAAGALAIVAGAAQIPATVATERVRASQYKRDIGDLEGARAAADDAVAAEPWAASPYAERAVVALAERDYKEARADALEAIEREPTYWWHRHLLMRVEIARRDEPAALAALEEARRLFPGLRIDEQAVRRAVAEG